MITSAITVLRPTAPGVPPGIALPAGPAGPSAYQQAGGDAVWGSLAKWLASLAAPTPTQAQITAAVAAFLAQPGAMSQLLASLPTSPPTGGGAFLDNGIVTVI